MTSQTTKQRIGTGTGKGARLLALELGAALAAQVAVIPVAERQARAAFAERVVFASNRTTGTGVNNPTGDYEIFRMDADGTNVRQLTTNTVPGFGPTLSPGKTKLAYHSHDKQASNPEGDNEIYRMSVLDGKGKRNLTNNGTGVYDGVYPD